MTDMQIFVHNALWRYQPPAKDELERVRPKEIEKALAREELADKVIRMMEHGTYYTIQELLPAITSSLAGHVMRLLIQQGKVTRKMGRCNHKGQVKFIRSSH